MPPTLDPTGMPHEVRVLLGKAARRREVPAGTVVFRPGDAPSDLLILLEGTLRVQQVSEGGREVVLYRVRPGETCVLTTACLMNEEGYAAEGVAETDLMLAAIARTTFDELMARRRERRRD